MPPTTKSLSQTASSKKKIKSSSTRGKTVKLESGTPSSSEPAKSKRFDPLTAFSSSTQTPVSGSGSLSTTTIPFHTSKAKVRVKDKAKATSLAVADDAALWVDQYEPATEAELAVHVKKVDNVRQWLTEAFDGGPSGALKKYRRILTLTGPAGTGKTSTIRVLAREMEFEILEWRSSAVENSQAPFNEESLLYPASDTSTLFSGQVHNSEGLFTRFEAFLTRATSCNSIFDALSSRARSTTKRIILLEDLPNILHQKTQTRFHEALLSVVNTPPSEPPVPLVIIVSDAGLHGEERDIRFSEGKFFGPDKAQVVDVRTVIPKDLLSGPYVTDISFNPIAPTLLRKALQSMLNKHFASNSGTAVLMHLKEVLDAIVDSANGDIRSAINTLQFACLVEIPGQKKKSKGSAMVMETVTRREQTLALFHLLGKVLYNKRKGDPPSSSATSKDLQKERDLDAVLKDPTKLPPHLSHHDRRASRVNVDTLYSDSPIDSSLFALYIHQNFVQFCDDIDHCSNVSDWLSWVDSSGGEMWYQANPHQFHLLTLGTLHSLPSPVQRRSQKYYKPEFFSFLQKEKEASHGVQRTKDWLVENALSTDDAGWRAGGWNQQEVILELGGVLRGRDAQQRGVSLADKPPALHKLFSQMDFTRGANSIRPQQLNEHDVPDATQSTEDNAALEVLGSSSHSQQEQQAGGWLAADDIEDFE